MRPPLRHEKGPFTLDPFEPRSMLSINPADAPTPFYAAPPGTPIRVVAAADLDHDGDQDLVLAEGGSIIALRNRGNGTFLRPLLASLPDGLPHKAATYSIDRLDPGDFDGDGKLDMLAGGRVFGPSGRAYRRTWVMAGDGAGHLTARSLIREYLLIAEGRTVFAFDVDGDGSDDLVSPQLRAWGYRNGRFVSKGSVSRAGSWESISAASLVDIDADGDTDVLVKRTYAQTPALLRNNGHGFDAENLSTDTHLPIPTARDLNGDGLPEIVFVGTRYEGSARSVVIAALTSNSGHFSGDPVSLYQETWQSVLSRGGHPVENYNSFYYTAEVSIDSVRDIGGDVRPDIVLAISSINTFAGPIFSENYGVALIAGGKAAAEVLPAFTPEPIAVAPRPVDPLPSIMGRLCTTDLDGDGLDDIVLARRSAVASGQWGEPGKGNLLFIHFAASGGPIGDRAHIPFRPPNVPHVDPGASVHAYATFLRPDPSVAITEADAFIDTNHNGLLDAADRRIAIATTPDSGTDGTRWSFTLHRRPFWGLDLRTIFFIAVDEAGAISTPVTERVLLP